MYFVFEKGGLVTIYFVFEKGGWVAMYFVIEEGGWFTMYFVFEKGGWATMYHVCGEDSCALSFMCLGGRVDHYVSCLWGGMLGDVKFEPLPLTRLLMPQSTLTR